MKVYLTGVDVIQTPKTVYKNNNDKTSKKLKQFQEETDIIKEDTINEDQKTHKHSKSRIKKKKKTIDKYQKKLNNFISNEDLKNNTNNNINNNNNKNFVVGKDFTSSRKKNLEAQKNKEIITEQLKEDFLDYLMLKEPKYADFDKISEDLRKQIFDNYNKYNKNLIEIEKKKKYHKDLLLQLEKNLINNYYVKDSSMIPIYESSIEKIKLEILTKEQEHDGYLKIYNELYNQNYTIKRKVLDEIELDRTNEDFHDQYKLLEIHAIVQVSKKQESLNKIEEYHKKILEEHKKEWKQKNKILKELRLEIEVFKEDEKELIHKLKKLKSKRSDIKKLIKERKKKNLTYHENLIKNVKRYQKSYLSMNKIFKSVNAKNLDDVLLDVNAINGRFNNLKNLIIKLNQEISDLNSTLSKHKINLENIKKQISENKNKKIMAFTEKEQEKIFQIKNDFKNEKDEQNEIREEIQKKIVVFQGGIIFIFQKLKSLVLNIKFLKSFISPKMLSIIHKFKHQQYKVNYDKINKKFFKQFSFLFFEYCHIVFYLYLRLMCSGINIPSKKNRNEIIKIQVNNKMYLNMYEDKIKKTLKEYKHRSELKLEKQKELNEKAKQKEIQEKIDNQLMAEKKTINTKQMYNKFIEYLREQEQKKINSKTKDSNNKTKKSSSKKNEFFFTGIHPEKLNPTNILESSSSSSSSSIGNTTSQLGFKKKKAGTILIPFEQKEDFLEKNRNKLMNIFSKYQNNLVEDVHKNSIFKKRKKKLRKSRSDIPPNIFNFIPDKQYNPYFSFQKKSSTKRDDEMEEKKIKKHSLFDENYTYDDEGGPDTYVGEGGGHNEKKRKIINYYAFFKLNKDRANIYKKKNDLRKLQMAYFGGRFLNTKINPEIFSDENHLNDLVDNYFLKQEHEQYNNNKKIRLKNYKKNSVFYISANKSMKDKVSFPWKRDKSREKNCYSSNDRVKNQNYSYVKAKYLDYKQKRLTRTRTHRFNRLNLPLFSKTYNQFNIYSPNNLYRRGIE